MKIYVASSWRNHYQEDIVAILRNANHEVYDFKNPSIDNHGFKWAEIDENWQSWDNKKYINNLNHPIANNGFKSDFDAMKWADACVLVLPSGRSAHIEAGYFIGSNKPLIIYIPENVEPELMYKMTNYIYSSIKEILSLLKDLENIV